MLRFCRRSRRSANAHTKMNSISGSEGSYNVLKPKGPLISSPDSLARLDVVKRFRRLSIKERDIERLLRLRWILSSGTRYNHGISITMLCKVDKG